MDFNEFYKSFNKKPTYSDLRHMYYEKLMKSPRQEDRDIFLMGYREGYFDGFLMGVNNKLKG